MRLGVCCLLPEQKGFLEGSPTQPRIWEDFSALLEMLQKNKRKRKNISVFFPLKFHCMVLSTDNWKCELLTHYTNLKLIIPFSVCKIIASVSSKLPVCLTSLKITVQPAQYHDCHADIICDTICGHGINRVSLLPITTHTECEEINWGAVF